MKHYVICIRTSLSMTQWHCFVACVAWEVKEIFVRVYLSDVESHVTLVMTDHFHPESSKKPRWIMEYSVFIKATWVSTCIQLWKKGFWRQMFSENKFIFLILTFIILFVFLGAFSTKKQKNMYLQKICDFSQLNEGINGLCRNFH